MKTWIAAIMVVTCATWAYAQSGLSVTVTPPLFQLTIGPGESWSSALKVVNSNDFDVTYYAEVVDFVAEGEGGQASFIPLIDSSEGEGGTHITLASWIDVAKEPFTVRRGTSAELPFTVRVPLDAAPGGHYAAILVGTQPGERRTDGPSMRISSMVSSLLFVRIKGDVEESGRIREFRTTEELYETQKADFILRFENTGNAHLRPQGDITIYNMWGKERGKVSINQKSQFGNVLPESTRRYEFTWDGEDSLFDIGRYRAEVTLTFGSDQKQNTSYATYFWIVPIVPVSVTFATILVFALLITWLIRRYIKRALTLEKARYGISDMGTTPRMNTLVAPIKEGAVDLRLVMGGRTQYSGDSLQVAKVEIRQLTFLQFIKKYGAFFLFIGLVFLGALSIWNYFDDVLTSSREFEVTDVTSAEESLK